VSRIAELTLPAADVLWEDLRLIRVPPFPLEVPAHTQTYEERLRLKDTVYGELEGAGLTHRRQPVPELLDALRLLAQPAVRLDALALLDIADEVPLRAVVVARGRQALLAVQRDGVITLDAIRETALAASIVGVVPPNRPGKAAAVTVPASAAQGRGSRSDVQRLAELQTIMSTPVLRAGQFGISTVNRDGRDTRQPGLNWFDTEEGRFAASITRGRDGESWTNVAPADNRRLTYRLAESLAASR
jgi:hypothetical protein